MLAPAEKARFDDAGFVVLEEDPGFASWLSTARLAADRILADPAQRRRNMACDGTWFVGVDALPNDASGMLHGVALKSRALVAMNRRWGRLPLHRAQLSVTFPGYPRPRDGESEGAFRYRVKRDAAHVDGLLPVGPRRRRMLKEPHAFILGFPLNPCTAETAPLVVWPGSHVLLGRAFRKTLAAHPDAHRQAVDLTEIYQRARRRVFSELTRLPVVACPGQSILLHRHLLHGVGPWFAGASDPGGGRRIAYFRPCLPSIAPWIDARC
ncbi:MAG: hypothetical protein AAF982_04800 [Pseudomonadota bacterium]